MPPSIEILHERLKNRRTDSAEVIKRRIAKAYEEIRHANEFNYVIINDDLGEALTDLVSIIRTSRLQFASQRKKYPALFEVSL
jgi:guanylate kinase